ncbi:MAG TPA: pilus assembly protein N-terminal domain-containing protein, partial [Vicinamibacterales bacterium]|nr:pilus assembly protein N-terminal domain-containing protein [Vicinamibacterales bacterium]
GPRAVQLLVGRSTLVDVGSPIARVSLTSADVADALVTGPTQLLVHGKLPGAISMFVWDRSGAITRYEIAVQRDLDRLNTQVSQLFPGERIQAHSNGKSVVLSGLVSSKEVADKAVAVAGGYVDNKADVVTLLQVQPGQRSNQVLLRVRFAEVSRTAMSEWGMSIFTSPTGIGNTIGRSTTQQYPAPGYSDLAWTKAGSGFGDPVSSASGKLVFSDFLNLFLLNQQYDLGVLIKALQQRGLFQSLAEPNLIAESGKEASFLAGGEFPIPVAQGSAANMAVSVQFKEFGIRLNFTPTVSGDRVHLKVKPEVSTLDYGNAVVLNGFRIPALSTRRTETEVELNNRQTFAIAGLMNNSMQQTMQKIPGLGDIPILGYLFKSKAAQRDQTELVVMITPEILPNNSPGVTPALPNYPEQFLPPLSSEKARPVPPPAFTTGTRSQASAQEAASAASARNDIERAQDRAQQALEGGTSQPAQPLTSAPVVAAQAPVQAAAPLPAQPEARVDLSEDQRQLEKATLEQAERDAKAAEKARKEAAKLAREQAERDAVAAREQAKRDEAAAKEQARRDEAAAKEQAKRDAVAAREKAKADQLAQEEAKRQAEVAKREAAREQERQQAIEAAAERLRAAEAEYQAELARRSTR